MQRDVLIGVLVFLRAPAIGPEMGLRGEVVLAGDVLDVAVGHGRRLFVGQRSVVGQSSRVEQRFYVCFVGGGPAGRVTRRPPVSQP